MKTKLYIEEPTITAGMTMKEPAGKEENNMALHVCSDPAAIIDNRKMLAASLELELDDFVCAHQTHSANFHRVTRADKGRGAFRADTAIPDTDALYTDEFDIVLCSFSADCVPVILQHEESGIIGVIHSGWQGTVKEISLKLFRHLVDNEKCDPAGFRVQIGAAISQEKFEVDKDVYDKFDHLGYADPFMYFNDTTGKYHIDNQQTVKKQCELAGIPADNVTIDATCTYQNPDGFSYRQEKACGRHLSYIVKKSSGQ